MSTAEDQGARAEVFADRMLRIANRREDKAIELGLRMCQQRQLSPAQIVDALTPYAARVDRLRAAAASVTCSAKELRI